MTLFFKTTLLIVALFAGHGFVTAADLWTGTCRNVTESTDGNLKLYVNEDSGRITGFISISGWLVGSGEITGRQTGNRIEFESKDPAYGLSITWKGTVKDGRISGEYFVKPMPSIGITRQVGEWAVSVFVGSVEKGAVNEDRFKKLFIFDLERDLNSPMSLADGTVTSGAEILFEDIHPIGTAVAVTVNSVDVVWKDGSTSFTREDLRKYRVTITLYWHGPIRKFGQTKIALNYNETLGEFTGLEVLSTNGVTTEKARKVAFAVSALVAKAALDAFLADQ